MKNNVEGKEEEGQIPIKMFEKDIENYIIYIYLNTKNTHEYRPPKPLYAIAIAFYYFSEIEGKNLLLKTTQNSNIGLESVKMDWT